MWLYLAGAAIAGYLLFRNRNSLPPYLFVDDEGDLAFSEDSAGGRAIHQTILRYGRKAEGTLPDGTMWVRGTRGTGKPAGDSEYASNIYARALQLGGPVAAQFRWIIIERADIEAIGNGNPPEEVELKIVDPKLARAKGMLRPGQAWVYYG